MRAALRLLADIWPSIVATFLALLGAFLSMGLLGLILYHLVSPGLNLVYPPLTQWDQSQVWPVMLAMPLPWSPSFIVAGLVNRRVERKGWARRSRIPLYVAIIWLAALVTWLGLLAVNPTVWN